MAFILYKSHISHAMEESCQGRAKHHYLFHAGPQYTLILFQSLLFNMQNLNDMAEPVKLDLELHWTIGS